MEDTCAVCAETLEWVAYGECGHRVVCSTCVARLRFICHDPRCCICKTESRVVFVTKALGDFSRMINDFSVLPSEPKEGQLGLYWYHEGTRAFFDDVDHYRMVKAMLKLSCSVCDKMEEKSSNTSRRRGNFRNIEQLKGHLHHNHRLLMCSLCLEGRKGFICEQKLYTRSQLNQHIDRGDSEVDGSESERGGFMGHPICEFCKTPFYGDNELYTHMSTEHYTCFICQRQHPGQYEYFKNYDDLEIHFRQVHFLCEDEDCLAKKFVVFQSETEMKRHNTLEHGGRMSCSKRNAALQIPTSFRYQRSNKQDCRQGRALNFHRDFAEDEISMAIQASLDTANADSIHSFSSSVPGPQVTTDHGDATDIDKVTYPLESLSMTTLSCPAARRTRGLGTPFDGGRRTSLSKTQAHKKMMTVLSLGEKLFIQGGIVQDIRNDGRRRLDYRPLYVETGVIPQANGSARVRFGGTDVLASVKAEIGRPRLMQPDKGKVSIHVDCSPTATPIFEGRGGEELSSELSLALQRCLLGGKSGAGAGIDLSSLIIVEGKVCWDLYIDGLVVSSDGNLLDALGAAIKAALSNTGIPRVQVAADAASEEQPEVDISDEEFLQFDTSGVPVIVTLTKVGRHYIVDATPEEESQMSSAVSVSVHRKGLICGLTKRGSAGLDPIVILDMISVAKHVSEQFINKLDSEISAAKMREDE